MEDPDCQTQYHGDSESVGRSSGVRVTPAGIRVRECTGRDMVIVDWTEGQLRQGLALVV